MKIPFFGTISTFIGFFSDLKSKATAKPLKNKMAVNNIVKRGKVFFIFIMILF